MRRTIRKALGKPTRARLVFADHHETHAASAFFPSPFERAAIVTLDGVGEWSTATFGVGEGNTDPADRPRRLSPFAGPALFGVHLLLRLQGQQRRIQADGPGPLRPADLQGPDPRAPDRPQARRQLLARHGLLPVLPGVDHDGQAVRRALRRPAPRAGVAPRAAAHGPGRQHPGGDRRGRAADRPARPRADRHEPPGPGRRRRPQLRGQRPAARARAVSTISGSSPRPATPAARWGGPVRLASAPGKAPRADRPGQSAGQLPRPSLQHRPDLPVPGRAGGRPAVRERVRAARARRRAAGRRQGRGLVPGPDGIRPAGPRRPEHPGRPPLARRCRPP